MGYTVLLKRDILVGNMTMNLLMALLLTGEMVRGLSLERLSSMKRAECIHKIMIILTLQMQQLSLCGLDILEQILI